MRPPSLLASTALILTLLGVIAPATAQVPPSPTEVAAYSGLHAAAWRGNSSRVRDLLARGVAIDGRDPHGRTALHVATHARQHEVIRHLAEAGADLNALEKDRYDAVTIAAVADDEATLDLLLALGARPDNITSRYDGNALIAAAHLGHDGVVRRLIAAGAALDHVNNLNWTAVIEAIVLGDGGARHVATLKALVEAGADVRITDRNGHTPLELASRLGYTEMVHILEQAPVR